jgi:glutamate synthase (NADPH/NADH) small chain
VEVSLSEVKMIEDLGVTIKTNVTVGKDITFESILADHDAVFISIGLGAVPDLEIPGENLTGVLDGLDFIEETKTMPLDTIKFGNRICVIGAGNTGIDCATIATRLGADRVTIIYRRTEAEMPAYHFEYEFALTEGVDFAFLTQPVEVVGDGKVTGLKCIRMDLGEPDASGRRSSLPVEGSEFVLPCDMVIKAIGQKKHSPVLQKLAEFGIQQVKGYIAVDPETNRTHHSKIYAGGDCIRSVGEASTVMAVQDGKIAAKGIHAALLNAKQAEAAAAATT